ncbi:MAG: hypothetical protein HRT73_09415 [Flavobacteriales bacterium]|nr:hypothetical protein [Flavobacteriales bacterium]NQX98083.1 hypothetical protein [Flavobacteriales bacterium]
MKKSFFSKTLAFLFLCSLMIPLSVSMQSCSKKPKYNKSRNGGKRVGSSGHVGNRKNKNSHVWGK